MLNPIFRNATSVILRRCSSAPQIENSMENQGRSVDAAVREHSLHIVADIRLEGVTGSIPSLRTDINDIILLKRIHPTLRLVVVPDTTRFTRVGSHHGQKLLYDLEAAGIFVYFVAENIANDTHMAKMYLSFLFDAANQQARSIARNGTMGSERSFLDGKSPHARICPYGLDRLYLVEGKPQHIIRNLPDGTQQMLDPLNQQVIRTFGRNTGKGVPNHYIKQKSEHLVLVPGDQAHIAVVQTIFQMRYGEQDSITKIARHLNDLGIPGPEGGEWHKDTVQRISTSPIYLGTGIRNQTACGIYSISSGNGEPLPSKVTLEDLAKKSPKPKRRPRNEWVERPQPHLADFLPEAIRVLAQVAIDRHHEKKSAAKAITPDKDKHAKTSPYLLSKIMTSKQGGYPMTGQSKRSRNGGLYRRYLVSRAINVPKSNNELRGTIPADAVEPALMAIVKELILRKDDLRKALQDAVNEAGAENRGTIDIEAITKDIASRQKRIVTLSRRLTGDEQTDAPLETEIDRLHREVHDLVAHRRSAEHAKVAAEANPTDNVELLLEEFSAYVGALNHNDPAAAKDIIRLLVGRMEANLATKDVEIDLSVPKSLGRLLCGPKPVCLVSAFACGSGHEAHQENRLKIEAHLCQLTTENRRKCYVCRREAA